MPVFVGARKKIREILDTHDWQETSEHHYICRRCGDLVDLSPTTRVDQSPTYFINNNPQLGYTICLCETCVENEREYILEHLPTCNFRMMQKVLGNADS